MTVNADQMLKRASTFLPPGLESRLRTRVRQRRAVKRRIEFLLAPRLPGFSIGPHTYGWPAVPHYPNDGNLTIGDYCSIAGGVTIMLGNEHRTDWLTTYPFPALWPEAVSIEGHPTTKGDVTIGNDVWIGSKTTVLSGSSIEDGAVIGAGSVVAGSIPAYSVAVGNPCRVIRYRFEPNAIATLLALRWWDWPENIVTQALPILLSGDIDGIIGFARRRSLLLGEGA